MTEFWIVLEVAACGAPVTAPAAYEIAWIRGLRPPKKEVIVARSESDRTVKPAVGLRVPLNLWITGREAGWHSGKGPEIGHAQAGKIGAVVHAYELVDHFHVTRGANRPGGVGRCCP